MEEQSTKEKLLQTGRGEFLSKGFKDASLREIAKKAGYTLGAFYGYYPSKAALFDAIVAGPADALFRYYAGTHARFDALPEQRQATDWDHSTEDVMQELVRRIYADFDVFALVFSRAAGTRYEHYLQQFIDLEIDSTHHLLRVLAKQGRTVDVDGDLIHILVSAMFSCFTEMVCHNMPQEKAHQYAGQLRDFYAAGWHRLLDA